MQFISNIEKISKDYCIDSDELLFFNVNKRLLSDCPVGCSRGRSAGHVHALTLAGKPVREPYAVLKPGFETGGTT